MGILYTCPSSNHCNQMQLTVRRVGGVGRWKEGTRGPVSMVGELPAAVFATLRNLFIPCGAWGLLAPHPSFEKKTWVMSGVQPFCQEANGSTSTFLAVFEALG